jgi:hypothetical protein
MPQTIDPRFTFNFIGTDEHRYSRQVYWETLYSLSVNGRQFLLADRVVPHSTLPYALCAVYRSIRSRRKLDKGKTHEEKALFNRITALVETTHDESASIESIVTGPESGSTSITLTQPGYLGYQSPEVNIDIGEFAGITRRDCALIINGYTCHRILMLQYEAWRERIAAERLSLVRRGEKIVDFWDIVYGDPRYRQFVMDQMSVSCLHESAAQHFSEYLVRQLSHHFTKERLESMLGRTEAEASGFLPYHFVTILGYLQNGNLRRNNADPESTGRSFQVDPTLNLSEIVLRELNGRISRSLIRTLARAVLNKNIKDNGPVFVDELEVK